MPFTQGTRRLWIVAALGMVSLTVIYAVILALGIFSLRSPTQPVGDPYFSMLEVLIVAMMPLFIALMAAVHVWAPPNAKVFTLIALVFAGLLAGTTSSVHFVILIASRQAAFAALRWMQLFTSFQWPSIPYILDILAWDVFFPFSMVFAQQAFGANRLGAWIKGLMILSGALAFGGLSGLIDGNMQLRNIGIAGYVGVFPVAAVFIARLFWLTKSQPFPLPTDAGAGHDAAADGALWRQGLIEDDPR